MGATQFGGNADTPNQTQMTPEFQLTTSGTVRLTDGDAWLEAEAFEWLEDWT